MTSELDAPAAAPPMGTLTGGVHAFPVRVYYEDTDAAGIVYYANYLKFAERARTEMMRLLGAGHTALGATLGIAFVVRRLAADYRAPARLDDVLVVDTAVRALGGARLDLTQVVRRGAEVLVRLDLTLAMVRRDGRAVRLPAGLRTLLCSIRQSESCSVTVQG